MDARAIHQAALQRAQSGDANGAVRLLDDLLASAPLDVVALLIKGDVLARAGQDRAAVSAYRLALSAAHRSGGGPREALQRAQAFLAATSARSEAFLRARMDSAFPALERESPRFAQALDIMFGRKQVYAQQPLKFYFPGLAAIQFFPRSDFAWLGAIEAASDMIRADLDRALAQGDGFTPYVEADAAAKARDRTGMVANPNWSAHFLIKYGARIAPHAEAAGATLAALAGAPLADMPQRGPSVLFSALQPKTRIPPHHGFLNTRLICHVPLIIPGNCGLRVGNETRAWTYGEALVFDDSIEHEAWNESDALRVVLIFDIWRPDMTLAERAMINAVFAGIDAYSGEAPDWRE